MTYSSLTNWKYDKNLYHSIQSGPQRTSDDLNLTDTYLVVSSGYVYPSGVQQSWYGVNDYGADFGVIRLGPPNYAIEPEQVVKTHYVSITGVYYELWTASGILSGCTNSGYDNLPSGCYSGTADPACSITYPVGVSGALPSGCSVIYVSGIASSGVRDTFVVDGVLKPSLELRRGGVYIFDQSEASNATNGVLFSTTLDGYHTVTTSGYWVASGILSGCTNSGYDNLPSGCYSGTSTSGCTITYPVGPSGELPSGCSVIYPSGLITVLSSGTVYGSGVVVSGVAGSPGSQVVFTVPSYAPDDLYYFGTASSGLGSSLRIVTPLETRPWYYTTDWRAVTRSVSGYWTNYTETAPRASGLLTVYDGYRRQGLLSVANATVQTAFGPQPGLRDKGSYTWFGPNVPDNQNYAPFKTPEDNTGGQGSTGGPGIYPRVRFPALTNPTNDTSGSRAAWVYHYPSYCESYVEAVRAELPGQMSTVIRNMYRGRSSRYVPNYGSVYGVGGEGIRNIIRTFSPGA